MSNEIKAAIRATLMAVKAGLAMGKTSPELQQLTQKAIRAAEKVVGADTDNRIRRRRPG